MFLCLGLKTSYLAFYTSWSKWRVPEWWLQRFYNKTKQVMTIYLSVCYLESFYYFISYTHYLLLASYVVVLHLIFYSGLISLDHRWYVINICYTKRMSLNLFSYFTGTPTLFGKLHSSIRYSLTNYNVKCTLIISSKSASFGVKHWINQWQANAYVKVWLKFSLHRHNVTTTFFWIWQ